MVKLFSAPLLCRLPAPPPSGRLGSLTGAACPVDDAVALNDRVDEAAGSAIVSERVAWDDPRAVGLRDAMDGEIQGRYAGRGVDPEAIGAALAVNPADIVATVILLTSDGAPVGHAALRRLRDDFEVKRVVVDGSLRGQGLAGRLMAELELIARYAGARRLILQTGDRQPEAVALYRRLGYRDIAIYEPYVEAIPFSLCFEKVLDPQAAQH